VMSALPMTIDLIKTYNLGKVCRTLSKSGPTPGILIFKFLIPV
jgi:hypothetical protein